MPIRGTSSGRSSGEMLGFDPARPYEARVACGASGRGIAVWDVLKSCTRESSLDFRDRRPLGGAERLRRSSWPAHPQIRRICFNGGHGRGAVHEARPAASRRRPGGPAPAAAVHEPGATRRCRSPRSCRPGGRSCREPADAAAPLERRAADATAAPATGWNGSVMPQASPLAGIAQHRRRAGEQVRVHRRASSAAQLEAGGERVLDRGRRGGGPR